MSCLTWQLLDSVHSVFDSTPREAKLPMQQSDNMPGSPLYHSIGNQAAFSIYGLDCPTTEPRNAQKRFRTTDCFEGWSTGHKLCNQTCRLRLRTEQVFG